MSNQDKMGDSVSSVMKVFAILQALSEKKEIGVTELSQRIFMSKSTVYRFLQTMKSLGFVKQDGENDNYSLSMALFELGSKALENQDLIKIANTEMRIIGEETKETVHLGMLDGDSIIYLHKIDSEYNLRMYSKIGRRRPIYCTALGKILTAWVPENELVNLMASTVYEKHTDNTITNFKDFLTQVEIVRKQGFAEDNEEVELGLRCFAVPIYDRFGRIIAGLSLSLPTMRFDESDKMDLIAKLHARAAAISGELGFYHYPFNR